MACPAGVPTWRGTCSETRRVSAEGWRYTCCCSGPRLLDSFDGYCDDDDDGCPYHVFQTRGVRYFRCVFGLGVCVSVLYPRYHGRVCHMACHGSYALDAYQVLPSVLLI